MRWNRNRNPTHKSQAQPHRIRPSNRTALKLELQLTRTPRLDQRNEGGRVISPRRPPLSSPNAPRPPWLTRSISPPTRPYSRSDPCDGKKPVRSRAGCWFHWIDAGCSSGSTHGHGRRARASERETTVTAARSN
jgi:hypothetical protein